MGMEVEQAGPSKDKKYKAAGGGVYYFTNPSSEPTFTNLSYRRPPAVNLAQASSANTVDSYRQWQADFLVYQDEANIDNSSSSNNNSSGGGTSTLTRVLPLVGAPHHLISHAEERMDTVQAAARSGSGHIDGNLPGHSRVAAIVEADINLPSIIRSHPSYPRLVSAFLNCQKVGAPPEVVATLEELSYKEGDISSSCTHAQLGNDPELDRFMDAYCNVLQEYYEELTRPFQEAMMFCRKIELQLSSLTKGGIKLVPSGDLDQMSKTNPSSDEEEEVDVSYSGTQLQDVDLLANDRRIKEQLLQKYSGYISSLKKEFLKKKKKGKLPKEARKKLLDWWNQHYKWPYPSEGEKACLAGTTGLDQKQINNWFINQRKRHWKPTEDMHYTMLGETPSH